MAGALIKNKNIFLLLTLLLLILVLLVILPSQYLPLDSSYDKGQHGLYFFILSIAMWHGLKVGISRQIFILLCLAGVTEFLQHLLPYRVGSFSDFQANLSGILVGYCLIMIHVQYKKKKSKDH